jgi:hypothetical protein
MVGAGPYAAVLNRHVELADRLEWLHSVLAHLDTSQIRDQRERVLLRSNVAAEHAEELADGDWLHDQILAVVRLATELDYESRQHGLALVPLDWWGERTAGLLEADDAGAPPGSSTP